MVSKALKNVTCTMVKMEAIIFIPKSKTWYLDWDRIWSTDTLPQLPTTSKEVYTRGKALTTSPVRSLALPLELRSEFEFENIISKNKARMLKKDISH